MSDDLDAGMDDLGGLDDAVESSEPAGTYSPPDGEDVVDAEFVEVLADGTVLSNETGLDVTQPTVTVTDINGEPVNPEFGDELTQFGPPDPEASRMHTDAAAHGGGNGPGLKGGAGTSKRRRWFGGRGGGSGGSGGGHHFSLLGGVHLFSGNRADASLLRAGDVASVKPANNSLFGGGRRPASSRSRRPH